MQRINLTTEELHNIRSDIKGDMVFNDFEEKISNGYVLYLFNSSDDQNPIKIISTVEELNILRNI